MKQGTHEAKCRISLHTVFQMGKVVIPGRIKMSLLGRRDVIVPWKLFQSWLMGTFGDEVSFLTISQPFWT